MVRTATVIPCNIFVKTEIHEHYARLVTMILYVLHKLTNTRQVTHATYVRNRICPRVKLIIKIIIILLIIFLGFIKSKSC